jgi:hypothetical protein
MRSHTQTLNPRFVSLTASYDVASIIWLTRCYGHDRPPLAADLAAEGWQREHTERAVVQARGRAVQVDPIKITLKPPGNNRLKLKHDKLLSSFAFNFNLRRSTVVIVNYSVLRLPAGVTLTCQAWQGLSCTTRCSLLMRYYTTAAAAAAAALLVAAHAAALGSGFKP